MNTTEEKAVVSVNTQKAFDGSWTINREYFLFSILKLKILNISLDDFDVYIESLVQEKQKFRIDLLSNHRDLQLYFNILIFKNENVKGIPTKMSKMKHCNPNFSPNRENYKGKYDEILAYNEVLLIDKIEQYYMYCFMKYPRFCDNYLNKRRFLLKLRNAYSNTL